MQNYKLTIRYSGSNYHGWQIQKNADTVQARIKAALELLLKEEIVLTGAGRTDTGVHAMGQVANFYTAKEISTYRFIHSLNGILPGDIAITEMAAVPGSFNARFDAVSREYRYFLYHQKNPFLAGSAYYSHRKYDAAVLNEYACRFLGEHQFYSFSKELPKNGSANCIVSIANWKCTAEMSVFVIKANRFLHGMVRMITGTILHAAKESMPAAEIDRMLQGKYENRFAVPPCGLYLYKVNYKQQA